MRRLFCTAFFFAISSIAFAIEASMARSVFYRRSGPTATPQLDLYWQVDPRSLHYVFGADSTLTARYRTAIRILSDTGVVTTDVYAIATPPRAPATVLSQSLLDRYRILLPPGRYRLEVALTEPGYEGEAAVLRDSLTIDPPGTGTYLSDAQLLDTFYASKMADSFTRRGVRAVPLCANFLDDGRNRLHHYTECYGLEAIAPERYPLRRRAYVTRRPDDPPAAHLQTVDTLRTLAEAAGYGTLPIGTLTSGNWYFQVRIEDKDGKPMAATRRAFQRYNAHPEPVPSASSDSATGAGTYINLANTFVSKYKAEQVRAVLKMVRPIADPTEMAAILLLLEKPDDLLSRYFMYNFFSQRNAAKPEDAWDAYSARVREVNKLYGAGGRPGYETDRGVLHLKYGAPAERITVRSEVGALPYEVWVYEVLPRTARRSFFLFYQPPDMVGGYRLLHSTVPDDMYNPDWRRQLYPAGAPSGTAASSSRAEQFFGGR